MQSSIKVLVTDAGYKHTLGIVRSLGQAGYYVIVMGTNKRSQSFYSKYCQEKLVSPDPKNKVEFIHFLKNYLINNKIDVLIPVGYNSTITISNNRNELLPYVKIPIAEKKAIDIASDKRKTLQLAKNLQILIPREYNSIEKIDRYPIVIKGIYESGQIKYINSKEEAETIDLATNVIQEYINGEGYGFYALFNRGYVRAFFMHQRIREYPVTGGSSTCAKSVYCDELKKIGLKILEELHWHGVAMVEFKKKLYNGDYVLMEINPKFWGSLDLSIASKVNFPKLLVEMTIEGDVELINQYDTDITYRWPFPDEILHLCANPYSIPEIISDFFDKRAYCNIIIRDPLPTLIQIIDTFFILSSKILNRKIKYPHGKPKKNYDC